MGDRKRTRSSPLRGAASPRRQQISGAASPRLEKNQLPKKTLLPPTTVPFGASAGSLQVIAGSPTHAASFPLIWTFPVPVSIVAWFVGGFWNGPAAGT